MNGNATTDAEPPHRPRLEIWNMIGSVALSFVVSRFSVFALILLSRMDVIRGPLWFPGGLKAVLTGGEAAVHLAPARGADWTTWVQQVPSLSLSPLFASVVKAASFLLPDADLAGILVANFWLFVAGLLLYRMVGIGGGDARTSREAVMLMMFSPAAFFYSTATPDSMLLALAIAAVLAARTGRWLLAITAAVAAAATSSYGVWLIVPLVVEFLQQRRGRTVATGTMFLLAVPIGCSLVLLALGSSWFGDPLAAFQTGARWERGFASLLQLSQTFASYRIFYESLFWITIGSAVLVIAAGWHLKLPRSYFSLCAALVAACLWSHDLQAPRVLGMLFPLFTIMGALSARYRGSYDVMLVCAVALLALCTVAAANGFWIS